MHYNDTCINSMDKRNRRTYMDKQFLESVLDALDFIFDKWDQNITDGSLRVTSPVLRRLVSYGDLGRAWREVGFTKEFSISAPDLRAMIDGYPILRIDFAAAGGALYQGAQLSGIKILDMARQPNQTQGEPPYQSFSVSSFQRSECLLLTRRYKLGGMKQEILTRGELINFFANKYGGAHYDPKRTSSKEELLDWFLNNFPLKVLDKRVIYFELLSIGQSLATSQDVQKLRNELRNVLNNQ